MAQTGYTPILIYSSSTAAAAPIAGNLTNSTLGSELAINITDGKLFYKDSANAIQVIGWKVVPTTAGGTGLTSYTQGDLLYYNSGTTLTALPKNTTATRYLSNTGTNNNPAWAQIDLSNGVTGTLPVGNGGTGATTFTAGRVLFGNTTSAINTDANLFWDNTNKRLGVGTNAPAYLLHVYNGGGNGQIGLNFGTANNGLIEAFSSGLNLAALGATSYMTFAAGGTSTSEAIRIHASRGVSIGNTTDPGATNLSVSGNVVLATANKYVRVSSASTDFDISGVNGATDYIGFAANTTNRFQFWSTGAAYNTLGTWGTISDERLKENINNATEKLADVLKLRVVNYNLKTDPEIKQIGFVAQEIEQVFPGLVEQGEPTEDGDFYKSVKTSVLIPILVKAMQEQQTQIDELKNQLAQLKGN